jgi:mRNA-degrading endonuclease RelE of RelBE toxin-antitoxin system
VTLRVVVRGAARRELRRLDASERARVVAAIERYANTREGDVRKLIDLSPPQWRLRVGEYRVRFLVEGDTLEVLHVLPRGKAYR